jgi:hypothetical protein
MIATPIPRGPRRPVRRLSAVEPLRAQAWQIQGQHRRATTALPFGLAELDSTSRVAGARAAVRRMRSPAAGTAPLIAALTEVNQNPKVTRNGTDFGAPRYRIDIYEDMSLDWRKECQPYNNPAKSGKIRRPSFSPAIPIVDSPTVFVDVRHNPAHSCA